MPAGGVIGIGDGVLVGLKTVLCRVAVLGAVTLSAQAAFAQTPCKPGLDAPPLVTSGVLLGAINPTAAPLQYIDETGKMVGMDVEFGDLIAARLCLKMQFQSTEFAAMIPSLRAGRIEMIATFMYYTPERAPQVLMIPSGAASLTIVGPAADARTITGPESFSGQRFGTQLGSIDDVTARKASEELAKAGHAPIDVRTFTNYADLLQALAAGQIDGAFVGTDQAFYYRDKGQTFFRIAATGLNPHAEALAFKEPAVAAAVVEALNHMQQDGSFGALFGRYHHCMLPPPYKVTTGPIEQPVCPPAKS